MSFKISVEVELSSNQKRIARGGAAIGVVVASMGIGVALATAPPTPFLNAQKLSSEQMNTNFNGLDLRLKVIETTFGVPAGTIVAFGGPVAPAGWTLCDGSLRDGNNPVYSALYAEIGTSFGGTSSLQQFNLPNTSGIFLRGVGTQSVSGVTYAGTLGQTQADQFQGHWHDVLGSANGGRHIGDYVGIQPGPNGAISYLETGDRPLARGVMDDGANGTPRIGAETQPVNISVNYIIKL